ncbi:hypothetical protein [Microvirga solisilvae]|uniref:hypothetical protein n=1 Tax=Microvirga solisilvae TaxID=2919498 RepID=UPI001FAF9577|nr:hypothetical protein [Microvirga solisilvae]
MRKLLWILAWTGVAIWSLFAWGAYGLLDLFGGLAVRNADIVTDHPETVEWLSWALATLRSLGLGAIVFVWASVSLVILAVAALLGRVLSPSRQAHQNSQWRDFPERAGGPDTNLPHLRTPPRQIERR